MRPDIDLSDHVLKAGMLILPVEARKRTRALTLSATADEEGWL